MAVIALVLPTQLVALLDSRTDMITAEGHRELDFAAAEAIRANARQVDAVTTGMNLGGAALCLTPLVLAGALVAVVFVRRSGGINDLR